VTARVELTAANVAASQRARGVLDDGPVEAEELGWGISNVVLKVESGAGCMVVKQSLPRLRVAAVWEFDQSRIVVERECMSYLGRVLPRGAVPEVVFFDDENFVFAMSCAPPGGVLWKEALLRGEVDLDAARRAGALLAAIQTASSSDTVARERFADRTVLMQGRVDPYHRTAALVNPGLAPFIEEEVERMLATRRVLVLGDYAPKNTFVYADKVLVLDFEVAHWGDPGFDPAFCLNHLLLKAIHFASRAPAYLEAASVFWHAYRDDLPDAVADGIELATARELGCLLLARIDGKSKIEYLTDEGARAFAHGLATEVLRERIDAPEDVLALAAERLDRATAAR
jgi:aminoglycoside phosphotransferase (APT) family kinase protein